MQNQFFNSYQKYDSNKMLMQTFGRGNMPILVEPKLSERNAFEQEKIIREKYAKRRENSSKGKERLENFQHRNLYEEQRNQQNLGKDMGYIRSKAQFQNIDNINDKINGLIKSISMSCHKKDGLPVKSIKIQKCQTNQKMPKKDIDLKRDKLLESAIARRTFVNGFDSFGPKQKEQANWFKEQKKQKKNFNYESRNDKSSIQSNHNYKKEEKKSAKRDEEDQLQSRIKKIQQKISVYEQKMGYLQPNNKNFKKEYIEKTVEKQALKQIKDSSNKNQFGSRIVQNDKQYPKKQEKTAKKDAYAVIQKQSNKKSYKENNDPFNYNQKQNRKQERMFQALQIKSKNLQTDKNKDLQRSKKNTAEKQQNHSKLQFQKHQKIHKNIQKIEKTQSVQLQSSKALKMHQKSTFIKAILKQIQYDQDFRHAKHMFGGIEGLFDENYQSDKEKWINLREELKRQGFSMSINEVKQIFMPRDDQIDPFMSVSHSHDQLIHGVIFAYRTAQKHWNDHIYRSWTLWQLKQSNFTSENLDRGKKGYISLQDLTFYINTENDGNYRNRDMLLIFNRLAENSPKKSEHTLSFKVIIDRLLSL